MTTVMFLIGQTNKQTGVQWSRGWFLDPPFGHLAPGDQIRQNIKVKQLLKSRLKVQV